MPAVAAVLTRLSRRRKLVRGLVTKDTHPAVTTRVKRLHALLGATSAYLARLEPAVSAYNIRAVARAKRNPSALANRIVVNSAAHSLYAFKSLLEAADLISRGKDAEAARHLLKELLTTGFKIGIKLTPLRYLKDAADALEALGDILRTRKAARLRRQQVKVATDLLNWLDAVELVVFAWCYAAQLFLLAMRGRGQTPGPRIVARVEAEIAVAAKAWR